MANVVNIVIKGTDTSSAAFDKAAAGAKRLSASTAQLGQATKNLGGIFNATGSVASALGATQLASLANQTQMLAMAGAQAAQSFKAMNSALKASLVGLIAIGAAFAINKVIEHVESLKNAAEATKKLGEMTRETEARIFGLASAHKGAMMQEDIRHLKALENIQELEKAGADAAAVEKALKEESMRHTTEMWKIKKDALKEAADFKKHLDEEAQAGQVQNFISLMESEGAMQLEQLESRKEFIEAYRDFWMESHRSMFSYAAQGSKVISSGLSNALVDVMMRTKSAAEAFKELGLSIVRMFAQWTINRAIAFVAEKVMAAVGLGLAKAQAAATSGIAAGVAAAWAPAATASLIATYGSSASAAALLIPAMAANQAAATGMSLAGGAAHGGLDYVPSEQTFLLQKGERVVQPKQNERLTSMLDDYEGGGGGGRMIHVSIMMDGNTLFSAIGNASRDGRLIIAAKGVR